MNPYVTDHGMIERILAAARRGVRVRLVVSETSNSSQATAALKHRYAELLAAGAELYEVPGTVVHAKVVVADDEVSFGTVNLDAWSLHRDSEIMLLARSAEVAARVRGAAVRAGHRARAARDGRRRPARAGWSPRCGTRSRRCCEHVAPLTGVHPPATGAGHIAATGARRDDRRERSGPSEGVRMTEMGPPDKVNWATVDDGAIRPHEGATGCCSRGS